MKKKVVIKEVDAAEFYLRRLCACGKINKHWMGIANEVWKYYNTL